MNAVLKPAGPAIPYGVHSHLPPEVYYQRRLDEANATGLKHMLRSPAHFFHYITSPDDDKQSPALTFGRALHCAVLEPDVFASTYAVVSADAPAYPGVRQWNAKKPSIDSLAAMDWWLQWESDNAGRTRLSAQDYDRIQGMAQSVQNNPVARGMLVGGDREVTFSWQDEETGLDCKARCDLFAADYMMMDLKSCRDASRDGFGRAIEAYGYDLQASHYIDAVRATGQSIKFFLFLCIEAQAPYVAQVHKLAPRTEAAGWDLRQLAIKRQAECLRTGRWPGYSEQVIETEKPEYGFRRNEENDV